MPFLTGKVRFEGEALEYTQWAGNRIHTAGCHEPAIKNAGDCSPALVSATRTEASAALADLQRVLDALDAVDIAGQLQRAVASLVGLDEAAQLHRTLEGLDVDLMRLGHRI